VKSFQISLLYYPFTVDTRSTLNFFIPAASSTPRPTVSENFQLIIDRAQRSARSTDLSMPVLDELEQTVRDVL